MKVVILIVLSLTITICVLSAFAQKRGAVPSSNNPQTMEREARRIADQFWQGLTKCGRSYFLYSDVRLFEFRDTPRFEFQGEALKPRVLTRVEKLNGVDPLPAEWNGGTKVSFDICRMNDAAYGYGQTVWHGWGNWSDQHCEFGTGISRVKGKWTISTLKKITCDDLAGWGFTGSPTSRKRPAASDNAARNTRTDFNSELASYIEIELNSLEKTGSWAMGEIGNQTMDVISKRLNLLGVIPNGIERIEKSDRILVVKFPPLRNPERVKRVITTNGHLEILHLMKSSNQTEPLQSFSTRQAAIQALGGMIPDNTRVLPYRQSRAQAQRDLRWAIAKLPELVNVVGWKECVVVSRDPGHKTTLACSLSDTSARSLAEWTRSNVGQTIGLVFERNIIAQLLVHGEITKLQVTVDDDMADELTIISKSGPLPVPLRINSEGVLSTYRPK